MVYPQGLAPLHNKRTSQSSGFTLAELLVVTAILGLLSSVVLTRLNGLKIRANDAVRVANLEQIRQALEQYHIDHDGYPATFAPGNPIDKVGECFGSPDNYIPGLVPAYFSRLPTDPALNCSGTAHSWVYASDGIDYKIITHVEGAYYGTFNDPAWDGGPNDCIVDGSNHTHYGVWTSGGACWSL